MAELLNEPVAHALTSYLTARAAQRRDHTDEALNWARTEAHDELIWQLRLAGLECEERGLAVDAAMEAMTREEMTRCQAMF